MILTNLMTRTAPMASSPTVLMGSMDLTDLTVPTASMDPMALTVMSGLSAAG
jgi:hypothetical protein